MKEMKRIELVISSINSAIDGSPASVRIDTDWFASVYSLLENRYHNVLITSEKQFSADRAQLRKFSKSLKDYYRSLENRLLADLREHAYSRVKELAEYAEQLASRIAEQESVFIEQKRQKAFLRISEYIDSLCASFPFLNPGDIEIKSFYFNYSPGAFERAKKDAEAQVQELSDRHDAYAAEKQQEALQEQKEAENFQEIVRHTDRLNARFRLDIDPHHFYVLRKMKIEDALNEISAYAETLSLEKDSGQSADPEPGSGLQEISEKLQSARYILMHDYNISLEVLNQACSDLQNFINRESYAQKT